jgi:GxxExxY protein
MHLDARTEGIIGAAIAVHRALGPGLLESAYSRCLAIELTHCEILYRREIPLSLNYRGNVIDGCYRLDFLVRDSVVVEVKSIDAVNKVHVAQTLTYMRIGGFPVGLILNFNVPVLKDGITRVSL